MGSIQPVFKNPATTTLLELAKSRRSIYTLAPESPISDEAIEAIIQDSVLHVPSSFNTQTSRVVLLLKEEHQKLWDIAFNIMETLVAAGQMPRELYENRTKPKLTGFRNGYGTVRMDMI
jgi:predicted oxidoreductase (fatty acid repression mutant protein)